jgi:pyruvate, water dikinase
MKFIKKFEEITLSDVDLVGGKNASLGYMITHLTSQGINVPSGFAITSLGYWHFLNHNKLVPVIHSLLHSLLDYHDIPSIQKVGTQLRAELLAGTIPDDLAQEITDAYDLLSKKYHTEACDVAVRSSATAEDLPDASFAGQQETYLHVNGHAQLLEAYKKSIASLFTDRAMVYRVEKGFDQSTIALSVGVQKMVRSDKALSGVMFTLDTDSGFSEVVMINASYGLGELVVKGEVTPDEYWIHKPTLREGFSPIIKKELGSKEHTMVYAADNATITVATSTKEQNSWSLTDEEVLCLARMALIIEDLYSNYKGSWCPMDIEWAKDGIDGHLYIVQARPETVYSRKAGEISLKRYVLNADQHAQKILVTGSSIGQKIVSGPARVIPCVDQINLVREGDIIVTTMTDPDWVPALKKAAGIITNCGGRTCHAAIVSRELGLPAVVGTGCATTAIKDGELVTIDGSQGSIGFVYQGKVPYTFEEITFDKTKKKAIPVALMLNVADPERAFTFSFLPNDGVGLARIEFIINNRIKIHPMACIYPEKIQDMSTRREIEKIACAYPTWSAFFIDSLVQGIATIAAAFYPKPVIVRTSDFKSNEYRNLIAGQYFEPQEENPMLGLRGACRYYDQHYREAFVLECKALKKVREVMGFTNVTIMLPFVRTIAEAKKVLELMATHGLVRGEAELKIIMMCEIPSNVLLIDEFSALFDGFSIGSNDLTQLTLGVDRDSGVLSKLFDERDPAVLKILKMAISGAQRNKKHISICGQAPSDYPEIAQFLIAQGIDALSLNPDSVISFINTYTSDVK